MCSFVAFAATKVSLRLPSNKQTSNVTMNNSSFPENASQRNWWEIFIAM